MKEKDLSRAVKELLNLYQQMGLLVYQKNQSGVIFLSDGKGGTRRFDNGNPGAADILVFAPHGITLHLELKSPKGRMSENQLRQSERLSALDHRYFVCRSVDDVLEVLALAGVNTQTAPP